VPPNFSLYCGLLVFALSANALLANSGFAKWAKTCGVGDEGRFTGGMF